jgi:5-methylcytosine-specific restriction endonuclease McrA
MVLRIVLIIDFNNASFLFINSNVFDIYEMPKAKYTPEERKRIQKENLLKNKQKCDRTNNSRIEAIEQGKKTYEVKKPCKNCGSFERYVSTKGCAPCAIKRGLEKLNNEELMKPYRTKEKQKKKLDKWRAKNPEKLKEQWGRYPEKNNARAAKRRALVKNQTLNLTEDQVKEIWTIYKECSRISIETGIPHEVDHIFPICKGGMHHPDNFQILTMKENRKKSGK